MLFGLGANTLWLSLHHILSIALVLAIADYVFGSVFFTTEPSHHALLHMRIGSAAALVLAVLVVITGIIPDINFGTPAAFNLTTANSFSTSTLKVTTDSLGNFAGPLLFDIMEHVSLIVPGIIAMVTVLIWSYRERVVESRDVRVAVLSLTAVAFGWIAVIAVMGIYLVKYLTFPVGS